ncbi:MAG TPA: hypothetical protein VD913_06435 [bacterium]|nr:hypothetical protein [bacterium]
MSKMNSSFWIQEIGISDILDSAFMAVLLYTAHVLFKRTRAGVILTGILMVAGLYLLARQFDLILTARIFQAFFAVILIALVVIFQEELRHIFEKVAVWSFQRRLWKPRHPVAASKMDPLL